MTHSRSYQIDDKREHIGERIHPNALLIEGPTGGDAVRGGGVSATDKRRGEDSGYNGHGLKRQGLETGPGMSNAACRADWQQTLLPRKHQLDGAPGDAW